MRPITLELVVFSLLLAGIVYSAGQATADLSTQSALRDALERRVAEVARLEDARDALQDRVVRLSGPVIDHELLDARLRKVLGVGRADEVLILAPDA